MNSPTSSPNAKCEARGNLLEGRSQAFLAGILVAPIIPDPATYGRTLHETIDLARRYRLSAYDASYLELALRTTWPLATLDSDLCRAAGLAGVRRFTPG